MINVFVLHNGRLSQINVENREDLENTLPIWVDLTDPNEEEREWVKSIYGVTLPGEDEVKDIEASARYYEADSGDLHLRTDFLIDDDDQPASADSPLQTQLPRSFGAKRAIQNSRCQDNYAPVPAPVRLPLSDTTTPAPLRAIRTTRQHEIAAPCASGTPALAAAHPRLNPQRHTPNTSHCVDRTIRLIHL